MISTIHFILYSIYYILYTIHYILYTILYTIYYIRYTTYYILYAIFFILYTIYYIHVASPTPPQWIVGLDPALCGDWQIDSASSAILTRCLHCFCIPRLTGQIIICFSDVFAHCRPFQHVCAHVWVGIGSRTAIAIMWQACAAPKHRK